MLSPALADGVFEHLLVETVPGLGQHLLGCWPPGSRWYADLVQKRLHGLGGRRLGSLADEVLVMTVQDSVAQRRSLAA